MNIRHSERILLNLTGEHGVELLEEKSIACKTLMIDGRIIACFGAVDEGYGIAEIWMIPSIYARENSVAGGRLALDWVKNLAECFQFRRLQTVSPNDALHVRWMLFLGFKKEGVLINYCNGKDYICWGKVYGN